MAVIKKKQKKKKNIISPKTKNCLFRVTRSYLDIQVKSIYLFICLFYFILFFYIFFLISRRKTQL